MSEAQDYLASLGIRVGVGSPSHPESGTVDTPYPTGTISFLAISTCIPWILLGYFMFKIRRVLFQHMRNRFEYVLSSRTDIYFEIEYRMFVGRELHSSVVLSDHRSSELVDIVEMAPVSDEVAEVELEEVVTG